jgi:hypothetical protein
MPTVTEITPVSQASPVPNDGDDSLFNEDSFISNESDESYKQCEATDIQEERLGKKLSVSA